MLKSVQKRHEERLRKVRRAACNLPVQELADDLFKLLEQVGTIAHEQDQELLRELRRKYNWDW